MFSIYSIFAHTYIFICMIFYYVILAAAATVLYIDMGIC